MFFIAFKFLWTFKHHLLIGKNKLMVIAIHKLHIFRKLYNSSIVLFIVSRKLYKLIQPSKIIYSVAAMKLHIFRKLYNINCAFTLNFDIFQNIWHQTRCFEIPITFKHHLLIGKNKLMVIAIHKLHIFRKLYSGCMIHFIAFT